MKVFLESPRQQGGGTYKVRKRASEPTCVGIVPFIPRLDERSRISNDVKLPIVVGIVPVNCLDGIVLESQSVRIIRMRKQTLPRPVLGPRVVALGKTEAALGTGSSGKRERDGKGAAYSDFKRIKFPI